MRFYVASIAIMLLCLAAEARTANAQGFGVELQNMMMPASGGMAGTSIARPQDLLSAINANPSALTQYKGTQFTFGGGFAGPTYNMSHRGDGVLPGIRPFSGKSGTPGTALANVGLTQDLNALGLPTTVGVALVSNAGFGVDLADIANSNNTALTFQVLSMKFATGVQLTDQLSIGTSSGMGIGLFDGLFVGRSKATTDYGLRWTIGMDYQADDYNTFGAYYQTKTEFRFDDAIILQPPVGPIGTTPVDVNLELPQNIGFGWANHQLMGGRLLLATDVVYKLWEEADLFRDVYNNQLVVQTGAQYTAGRAKFRIGYAWNENPMKEIVGKSISGIMPAGGTNAIQFIQGQVAAIGQHQISAGIGVTDVLPGVDLNLFAGGLLFESQQFGLTSASVESYWAGGGLTWRFNRGACCGAGAQDCW